MADIFDGYQPEAWDEMFSGPGEPRAAYDGLICALQPMDPSELRFGADPLARVFLDHGVTFDVGGRSGRSRSTSCRGSSTPRTGTSIERGVAQRVRALEAFLADVYGGAQVVARRRRPERC